MPLPVSISHTTPLAVGPYVAGSFDGTHLVLTSERLSAVVAGRTIKRQFRLTGTIAADDPNMLRGEYRETLWGYARQPITVLGTFTLKRPAPVVAANTVATAVPTVAAPVGAPRVGQLLAFEGQNPVVGAKHSRLRDSNRIKFANASPSATTLALSKNGVTFILNVTPFLTSVQTNRAICERR